MYGYVYLTTNLVNGKCYLGQHSVSNDALDENYLGSGTLLKKSIFKVWERKF